jgi:RNA-directed DNA polymerase
MWKLLWRWSCRRHKNRQKRWVKRRYFHAVGSENWVFQAVYADGTTTRQVKSIDTKIQRHQKIKADANPYLPEFEPYFEKLLETRWKQSQGGRKKLTSLWVRQLKRCPMCDQLITPDTGWNIHHIIERAKGGTDDMKNLVLLHPNCHRQLHSV